MDFTPSKKPFVERTLSDVHVLKNDLDMQKLKLRQLSETVRQLVDASNIPKEEFRWYKLLGGNTMRRTRKQKRGGQPVTMWPESVTQSAERTPAGLPGAIGMPDSRPRLLRSPASPRRLDFGDEPVQHQPGCVPISKRLPGHRNDQCEQSDSADGLDRAICVQPGEGQVGSLNECGPVRRGGKRYKKTKKASRRHRRRMH